MNRVLLTSCFTLVVLGFRVLCTTAVLIVSEAVLLILLVNGCVTVLMESYLSLVLLPVIMELLVFIAMLKDNNICQAFIASPHSLMLKRHIALPRAILVLIV